MGARPDLPEKNLSIPTTLSRAGSLSVPSLGANQGAGAADPSTTTELETCNDGHLYHNDDRNRLSGISRSHPSLTGAKEFEAYQFPAVISGKQSDKSKAADLLDVAGSPANQPFDGASPQRTQIGGFTAIQSRDESAFVSS